MEEKRKMCNRCVNPSEKGLAFNDHHIADRLQNNLLTMRRRWTEYDFDFTNRCLTDKFATKRRQGRHVSGVPIPRIYQHVTETMRVNRNIILVDSDVAVCNVLSVFLEACGYRIKTYHSADAFMDAAECTIEGIMLLDLHIDGMSGLDLQAELTNRGIFLPIIFISGHGCVQMSVKAIKGGAIDFLEKPLNHVKLLKSIREAFLLADGNKVHHDTAAELRRRHDNLKDREREVMQYVVAGKANKDIANLLGLSVRTIEVHRKSVMKKMGAESLPDLVRKYAMCQSTELISKKTLCGNTPNC